MLSALETSFTNAGLTLYDHMPAVLYGAPSAYLDITGVASSGFDSDQGQNTIGRIEGTIRIFVPLTQDPQLAEYQTMALANVVYDALDEATLSNRVKSSDIDEARFDRASLGPDEQPMRLLEVDMWLEGYGG
jgi:hypothetical protein